jgi:hypothetical protein
MTRLKQYMNEEYLRRIKNEYKDSFEVFVNPSVKEIRQVDDKDGVRFTADNKTKNVYVWDAYASIHNDVWSHNEINKGRNFNSTSCITVLHGECEFKGGKYVMNFSDEIHYQKGIGKEFYIRDIIKDFKWVNRYINIEGYLKHIMKENGYE